jgi:hypothetical protein
MPLIMPPAFDAVPAIIQVAGHKPAPQAPAPRPIKPSGAPPQPADGSQLPGVVGPVPVTLPPPQPPPRTTTSSSAQKR